MKSFLVLITTLFIISFSYLAMPEENIPKGNIHHVAVFWLKKPGDLEHRAILIDTTKTFAAIPGVLSVSAGLALPSERTVVDDSFDVAITITLEDEAALETYQNHPMHVRAKKEKLKSLVEKFIVYDFID